jgi:hypothetical protein
MSQLDDDPMERDGADPEVGGGAKKGTKGMSYRAEAMRNLQRARKSFGPDGEMTPQTSFLLESAQVLAILELADAVREGRQF